MQNRTLIFTLFLALTTTITLAQPKGMAYHEQPPLSTEKTDPLASPAALPSGNINLHGGSYPNTLNYYLDANYLSALIFNFFYSSLLDIDPITSEFTPGVAQNWEISTNKTTFTFHLDPAAHWSDGQPITAEDVAWTFSTLVASNTLTGPTKMSLEAFYPPEIIASNTIRFTCKAIHWRHLLTLASLQILPKHTYATQDFNKINFAFPVVSGPYCLNETKEGISIRLTKNTNWWARQKPRNQHLYNFQTLTFRFYADNMNAFEAFKKGQIDIYPVYIARLWMKETLDEPFNKNWIVKQTIYNHRPTGFQQFSMNMRRFPFDDRRVRVALAHLLNRREMLQALTYNQYVLQRSYYQDLYSPQHPCTNKLYEFDKPKARTLLKEAGWVINPKTGILEKDGRPFVFEFLARNQSEDKFLQIYAEDLKDVGINMKVIKKDWSAYLKDMDDFNFDMTWSSWSGALFINPEEMWASSEANRPSGHNVNGFTNTTIDKLIAQQKGIFDLETRNEIYRQIDYIITEEVPGILLWYMDCNRILYWNKFGTPPTILAKYGDEHSAFYLWWTDPDTQAELQDAMDNGLPLPPKPSQLYFDKTFQPEPN